jgi:hypothetical protein
LETKHKIYTIKNGDTLNSVSKYLGINPQEIRVYHNIHCKLNDLIENDFPKKLTTLLLSPFIEEKKEDFDDVLKTVKFGADFKLRFKPTYTKTNYDVRYTIGTGDQMSTMKYEVSVQLKEQEQKAFHMFEIERVSSIYINDKEASTIKDKLVEKVSSLLFPLQIVVNDNGKWMDVYNFKEIQERWESKKQEIVNEYGWELTEKYFVLSEKSLQSRQNLREFLQNDWFLATFFSGIHCKYTHELTFKNSAFFPLLANTKPLEYKVDQKIDKSLDDNNLINIEQKGILIDGRSKADFENNISFPHYLLMNESTEKVKGDFRSKYYLSPNYNLIESLFFECSIDLDVPKKVEVMISNTDNNILKLDKTDINYFIEK